MTNERKVAAQIRLAGKAFRGERKGFSAGHWLDIAEKSAQALTGDELDTAMAKIAMAREWMVSP